VWAVDAVSFHFGRVAGANSAFCFVIDLLT